MQLGQTFNRHTDTKPTAIKQPAASLGQPGGTKKNTEEPPTPITINSANNLTLRVIQRFSSQRRITGPNSRLPSSQACIRGEDLAKHQAARSTNGVVGSSGSRAPIAPSSRDKIPKSAQRFTIRRSLSPGHPHKHPDAKPHQEKQRESVDVVSHKLVQVPFCNKVGQPRVNVTG